MRSENALNRSNNTSRPARVSTGWGALLYLLLAVLPAALTAEEQISREAYVAQSHKDLLAPCKSPAFVECLDSSETRCLAQVNKLVEQCSQKLPAILTTKNFDESADEYASCVFGGLQETFNLSSEQIGQCENRAGLR